MKLDGAEQIDLEIAQRCFVRAAGELSQLVEAAERRDIHPAEFDQVQRDAETALRLLVQLRRPRESAA